MADSLPHFVVGQKGHADKLNALVDRVNAQDEELVKLRAELAKKQDKRVTKTTAK